MVQTVSIADAGRMQILALGGSNNFKFSSAFLGLITASRALLGGDMDLLDDRLPRVVAFVIGATCSVV